MGDKCLRGYFCGVVNVIEGIRMRGDSVDERLILWEDPVDEGLILWRYLVDEGMIRCWIQWMRG